jgi:CDP-glucose 4,6-dehydratase
MNYQQLFERTYKGKKVLLTGHTGFKGSWMLAWLHHLGSIVKGYALAPENEDDLYNMLNGDAYCDSVIADIRHGEKVSKTINEFQPDFIFHLAAQPLVRRSYTMPLYTFEVNVMGTANVLDAVRHLTKPCTVIIVTTDKVYENKEMDYSYKETDKLGGFDPYSASKAAAEIVVSSYRSSYFNPGKYNEHTKAIASARAGNVIGGGDRAKDRIIPDIVKAFTNNEAVVVRNPRSIRPWQHVLEPLSGYLLLGAKMAEQPAAFSTAWNFGPHNDDVLTVKEVVNEVIKVWGKGSYTMPEQNDQPHEAGLLKLDITRALNELQWQPKLNSAEAIRKTITWYKNATIVNAADLVQQQIEDFMSLNVERLRV